MTDDAAEAAFREAVGREDSLKRLGRALALSDRASFHLLEVATPRTLRAAVPVLSDAMGGKALAQFRVTLEHVSSREQLTATVFEALAATALAATPLLIDASAAMPSEADAWVWCFDRWNERRDRIASERSAPVVLAMPPWLAGRLAENAPDLWSVRGPSARADVGPPPSIAMIDRAPMEFPLTVANWPSEPPAAEDVRRALACMDDESDCAPEDIRVASIILLREAEEREKSRDAITSLRLRELAVGALERLLDANAGDEPLRLFCALGLIALGISSRERESFHAAFTSFSAASRLFEGVHFSAAATGSSLAVGAAAGLYACHSLLFLGDLGGIRQRLLAGDDFLKTALPLLSASDVFRISHLSLVIRADVAAGRYSEAPGATMELEHLIASDKAAPVRTFAMSALMEYHLDRGDPDRLSRIARDFLSVAADVRLKVGAARCALAADDPGTATRLLLSSLHGSVEADRLSVSQTDSEVTTAFVLGVEVARALHDDALTRQFVALARAALDDLQQRDPTSPRCQRLHVRFAEQRVAPGPR